jgi:hypothetical protein
MAIRSQVIPNWTANGFAQITNLTIRNRWNDITTHGDFTPQYLETGIMDLSIDISTNDRMIMNMFMPNHNIFSGIKLIEDEFICLWCASPNPITHRHCSQCGAPRGFIIK